MSSADPILSRLRADLDALFGPRVERVVLYGSRARGDARADSDYDVAVFLENLDDRWEAVDQLAPLVTRIVEETGAVVHAVPFRAGAYRDRTPLMHDLRQEGIDL